MTLHPGDPEGLAAVACLAVAFIGIVIYIAIEFHR